MIQGSVKDKPPFNDLVFSTQVEPGTWNIDPSAVGAAVEAGHVLCRVSRAFRKDKNITILKHCANEYALASGLGRNKGKYAVNLTILHFN